MTGMQIICWRESDRRFSANFVVKQGETWGWIAPPPQGLLDDLGDDTGADRFAALPNGEMATDVESHRLVQADGNSGVVAWHDHLDAVRQTNFAGDVRSPEEELRLIATEERRVSSTLVLAQD